MTDFVLAGVGGFIAPRHLDAIAALGGTLVAAFDPNDSVGILDSRFPDARFFQTKGELAEFCARTQWAGPRYFSVCAPTDAHASLSLFAMRLGFDVICEKPVALSLRELEVQEAAEQDSGHRIWPILQMRHHPALLELREQVLTSPGEYRHVELDYVTPRGDWYRKSWKGDRSRSGGVAVNIGIHLFDILTWIFGPARSVHIARATSLSVEGRFTLERATVNWRLSVNPSDHPDWSPGAVLRARRRMSVNGADVDFSEVAELHKSAYAAILAGESFGLEAARDSLSLALKVADEARRNEPA